MVSNTSYLKPGNILELINDDYDDNSKMRIVITDVDENKNIYARSIGFWNGLRWEMRLGTKGLWIFDHIAWRIV